MLLVMVLITETESKPGHPAFPLTFLIHKIKVRKVGLKIIWSQTAIFSMVETSLPIVLGIRAKTKGAVTSFSMTVNSVCVCVLAFNASASWVLFRKAHLVWWDLTQLLQRFSTSSRAANTGRKYSSDFVCMNKPNITNSDIIRMSSQANNANPKQLHTPLFPGILNTVRFHSNEC